MFLKFIGPAGMVPKPGQVNVLCKKAVWQTGVFPERESRQGGVRQGGVFVRTGSVAPAGADRRKIVGQNRRMSKPVLMG